MIYHFWLVYLLLIVDVVIQKVSCPNIALLDGLKVGCQYHILFALYSLSKQIENITYSLEILNCLSLCH